MQVCSAERIREDRAQGRAEEGARAVGGVCARNRGKMKAGTSG